MFRLHALSAVAAVVGLLASASPAAAGWLTIKNDTKHIIVIQETGPLSRVLRGKSVKLQPGETYREFQLLPGEKTVILSDSDGKGTVTDRLTWQKDDAPFAVKSEGTTLKLVAATKSK